MNNKQIYSEDTLILIKNGVVKFKENYQSRLTLEKLLAQSKDDILELVKLGISAKELVSFYNNLGIKVSIAKIKQAYFNKNSNRKTKLNQQNRNSKGAQNVK